MLSIYICYFLRLPTNEDKDKLYEGLSRVLKDIGYTIPKDKMRSIISSEIVQLSRRITLSEGITMNTSLQENIFSLFTCIMNKNNNEVYIIFIYLF